MKRVFGARATTAVAATIAAGAGVALAIFGVFGAHGAVPRTGPLIVRGSRSRSALPGAGGRPSRRSRTRRRLDDRPGPLRRLRLGGWPATPLSSRDRREDGIARRRRAEQKPTARGPKRDRGAPRFDSR